MEWKTKNVSSMLLYWLDNRLFSMDRSHYCLLEGECRKEIENSPGLAGCGLGSQQKEGCTSATMTDLWQN
ncbi:hypothetical protein DPMN_180153 [Dreissena polymorpha]|uniref:Uncharacterized protein n=1 Tax=Dreissena polymorpha TaxID=45954 RepID=A0A9D4IP52_DREPO|nr:hypothetical protein DPMN_180153 [Dreissena polymorpha]